ncbi:hypothetical protein LR48_Vigan05g045300 [Vigna angularis]|uniref:Bromo domain-containing protein n=2 Tax=Phaseolus angularis TaxID=3914 RepID=A0A0L9UJU8_PHAAN|nr:uncharacterized protein LOC108334234 isoform X1 [Vigna angularis]XP_017425455.1 uncharacterized protein LOC108334234 isoform X1 [Vigna angularis]KAG2372236.1 uncharacterized protein HKW66_Vig0208960 [Vigna angularis]KOM42849.1 hypothetical protein LR48_Vigan05g045300 [Vigna angularis]BAT93044.1 hypothetical protein VIGAN_07193400 [Vigna angularis var. angularis]
MENHQNHKGEAEPDRENNQNQNNNQAWGTWEELLLAFAVNRHGFKDWDTVAMEVQSRATRLLATARHCEQKFHDLSRRFADQCNDGVTPPQHDGEATGDNSDHVPWLDELRKLRVDELRREVQRRDDSIMSLQLEVKRLEEEKAKENDGKDGEKPDLAVPGEVRPENDKTGGEVEEVGPANSGPERTANADKMLPTTGDESDRENQSVNESNSTGSRFDKTGEGDAKLKVEPDPVQTGSKEVDPVARKGKPVGEESNNGSYDALAKVPTCESVPPSDERKVEQDDDSSELHDSVAHSGEGGTRESSEVQSSASLTRKRKTRRRKDVSGGDGRGGGASTLPENEEVAVKSEPLVGILELIKGHEHCSLIESRLESQLESDRYKDIVKQPLDMETIQSRIQKGQYFSCTSAFFRDLLLLFTNATVIFPVDSPESQAARQLHRLVTTEMKNHGQAQSDPIPRKSDSLPPNIPVAKADSLLSKNKASGPILVCRKRSTMSAKPSSTNFGQKNDQPIFNDKKERAPSDSKPPTKPSSSDTDEDEPPKAKEKPVTGARSLRRSNKNLNNKKLPSNSTPKAGSSGNKPSESLKPEKSKAEGGADKKRSAAADFLKRIKRNTSVDAVKGGGAGGGGSSSSSKGGGGGVGAKEQKKMVNNVKGDKGKERASRHGVGGGSGSADKRNKNIENSSQSKRSVGRPPKKAAETNAGSSKRGRENSASAGKDKRPKKRSKK